MSDDETDTEVLLPRKTGALFGHAEAERTLELLDEAAAAHFAAINA